MIQVVFVFHFMLLYFSPYVDIDQVIHYGKNKVAQNEKQQKTKWVLYPKTMANFEAFH